MDAVATPSAAEPGTVSHRRAAAGREIESRTVKLETGELSRARRRGAPPAIPEPFEAVDATAPAARGHGGDD
ncbi:MAG: hypothetical protein GVY33_07840 [Alphaproteobacteria bacterium]|nr:hypothetical protein [Alphaproteobacteria bacterium]